VPRPSATAPDGDATLPEGVLLDQIVTAIKRGLLEAFVSDDGAQREKKPIRRGEVVSEDRAARALPVRRADAVLWLRDEGLVSVLAGRRVVVWDGVLDRLQPQLPTPRKGALGGSQLRPLATPGRILG